jgi:hypothetical protein
VLPGWLRTAGAKRPTNQRQAAHRSGRPSAWLRPASRPAWRAADRLPRPAGRRSAVRAPG